MDRPLVSIIVNNYNYGRFVGQAIDSALGQTYANTEVIVVDDGSTDESRRVIERYGGRVKAIFKANGGQASAFNVGFTACGGAVVIFLDADDVLAPEAAERCVPFFDDAELVKVHWPLMLTDADLKPTGKLSPGPVLSEGDLRSHVFLNGPGSVATAPGGGTAWARWYLEKLMPLDERVYRYGDVPLMESAPFFGRIGFVREPLLLYRQHGRNDHSLRPPEVRAAECLVLYEHYARVLADYCRSHGHEPDLERWKRNSWWHRHDTLNKAIAALGSGGPFILVDDAVCEPGDIAGRRRLPFLEKNGQYWGKPADDAEAIAELERMRSEGAEHIVFAWVSRWWLDHYTGLAAHLRKNYPCVIDTDEVMAFALR